MITFNCDKCKEGELEFEIVDCDSGDGPWFQSWEAADLVRQTCQCDYTEEEMGRLELAAVDAGRDHIADLEVDRLLSAHGL